jgi:hypothetical protein
MARLLSAVVVLIVAFSAVPTSVIATPVAPALVVAPSGYGLEFGHVIDDAGNVRFTDDVAQRISEAGATWVRISFRLGGFQNWEETGTFGVSAATTRSSTRPNATACRWAACFPTKPGTD